MTTTTDSKISTLAVLELIVLTGLNLPTILHPVKRLDNGNGIFGILQDDYYDVEKLIHECDHEIVSCRLFNETGYTLTIR